MSVGGLWKVFVSGCFEDGRDGLEGIFTVIFSWAPGSGTVAGGRSGHCVRLRLRLRRGVSSYSGLIV